MTAAIYVREIDDTAFSVNFICSLIDIYYIHIL